MSHLREPLDTLVHKTLARAMLPIGGARVADQIHEFLGMCLLLLGGKQVWKVANHVVSLDEAGTMFVTGAAVSYTLPAPTLGCAYVFVQTADADMTIVGNANVIHKGTVAASAAAFQTAGQKIGSSALVTAINVNGTPKWLLYNLGGTTATVI